MRVLVTGASGFIGRHSLEPLVERGLEVHAVSRETRVVPSVTWHAADLLEGDRSVALLRELRPTHLLHVAWYAVPGKYWTSPENERWVEASQRLFRAFLDAGGTRIVGVGSCAEYDWSHEVLSETATPLAPKTPYGRSKLELSRRLGELSVSSAWARIFYLFGPHEHPDRLVPAVIRSVLRGELARCSHGRQRRDFLYVRDVGLALAALVASSVTGPVNVASGDAPPVRTLVEKLVSFVDPAGSAAFGVVPTPADDPARLVADVTRLTREVGFTPRFGLDAGLRESVSWWRGQLGR